MNAGQSIKSRIRAALSFNPELLGWVRRVCCAVGLATRTDRDFLFALAKKQKDVFFVEIGANDGCSGDFLYYFVKKYKWRGIALEPVPDIFAKLQRTYQNDKNVIPLCAALAERDGALMFYRVQPGEDVPEICDQLGSFSRDVIVSHKPLFPAIEERIVDVEVKTVRFDTLARQFGIEKIDVIVIDTEGYDFEVLKQIDFQRFRPSVVIYEQLHLSNTAKEESQALLRGLGYDVYNSYDTNYVAIRRQRGDSYRDWGSRKSLALRQKTLAKVSEEDESSAG
jgi:FkbM family methyltransferase